ncbi:BlaI/MecI/CopY family transcriptional regulator [Pseudonocardia sp. KRD291]|uniref:BlaI/MecI/CopY family transcriptional regulator n=1 Tax=Pseudonocardia sp. KRD291 TaxID=2792007 RepID=UPI001C49D49B|nr:BlaI/MecI/CopY family transcriptional regulator [Pseudonocardia sp. KRD291]MBW0106311.1 BlaI/MecI/CopY family transcriptional regulator [Pseudonocardia sp. KRD291]
MPTSDREAGDPGLEQALDVLGRLEARIMRAVWIGEVSPPFTVHDVHDLMPELAYTTVLTTMRRLADKGLLHAAAAVGRRSHHYRAAGNPATFMAVESEREAASVVERYGDAALAAFALRLEALSPEQRDSLHRLRRS